MPIGNINTLNPIFNNVMNSSTSDNVFNLTSSDNEIGHNMQLYLNAFNIDELPGNEGTTSIFNEYNIFALSRVAKASTPGNYDVTKMYDNKTKSFRTANSPTDVSDNQDRFRAPTAARIIQESNDGTYFGMGRAPYSWSDFLYCKYYGQIPNNQLVTLRRYTHPVHDNLEKIGDSEEVNLPIAQAITWLGDKTENKMNNVLKFSFGLIWKELESAVQSVEGNEVGFGAGLEAILGPNAIQALGGASQVADGSSSDIWSGQAEKEQEWLRKAWTDDGPYWNQVYGPVNVINKSHMRDRGLDFKNDISLKFHYSLTSINGVNPRVAMLDLITNFLSLTYNNAKFWGGSARYFPNYSHRVMFQGDTKAFYDGDMKTYWESIQAKMANIVGVAGGAISKMLTGEGGFFKQIQDAASGQNEGLNDIGTALLRTFMGKLTSMSRPNYLSVRSLLSGEPVGEWHLTVGNPMNPIAVIGNLLVDDVEMEFGEKLGADDFPTEITFTVKLKHGRPRDKGDIESMFNYGQGRMTYSPLIKSASESGTHGTAWQKDKADLRNANQGSKDSDKRITQEHLNYTEGKRNSETGDAKGRIKQRISTEWGRIYGDSTRLNTIFANKQNKQ